MSIVNKATGAATPAMSNSNTVNIASTEEVTMNKSTTVTTAISHNHEVKIMNTVKFEATELVLSTYMQDIAIHGHQQAVLHAASAARNLHTDWAYQRLARAVWEASQPDADKAWIMQAAWAELEHHSNEVGFGYKAGLVLTKSPAAQRNAAQMDLHPIALRVGESKTYTAITSLQHLQQVLRQEPELVASLKRNGAAVAVKDDLHAAWKAAPKWLRDEIISRATSAKYAEQEQKAVIVVDGKRRTVKGGAYAQMAALDAGGRAYRVRQGAERALQQVFKLAHQYANSLEFWAEVEPRLPRAETMNDEVYAGEEEQQYSSPIRTYTVTGRTVLEQYESKREIFDSIREDFEEALQEAEALFTALEELLLQTGEVTYLWDVIDADAGLFRPITGRGEAMGELNRRQEEYYAKRAAAELGLEASSSEELEGAVLEQFSPEEQAALLALVGGAA